MKTLKRITVLLLCASLLISASGCTLITVNPEKDNAQVIAKLGETEIKKLEFNNFMAYIEMQYKMSGLNLPTGKDLKAIKEDLYDQLIQQDALSMKADEEKLKVETDEIISQADLTYEQLEEALGEGFGNVLKKNYVTAEQFKEWMQSYQVKAAKASELTAKYQEKIEKDPSIVLDQTVGKIGETDVTRAQYDYYAINESIMSQAMGISDQDAEEMKKNAFDALAVNRANIQYADENGIKITDKAIKDEQKKLDDTLEQIGLSGEQLESALKSFFLTTKIYDSLQKEAAKGEAAKQAIRKAEEEKIEVSDAEIEEYYEKHKDDYDTSTVSAMHILTEDKNIAQDIYEKAKDLDKKGFDALMKELEGDDTVKEATDLGSFDRKTMVSEFTDAAFGAQKNSVVGPVKTEYGYHVLYVYDTDIKDPKSLEDVKDTIVETIKTEKADEAYTKLEEKLAEKEKVEIYDFSDPLTEYAEQIEKELGLVEYKNRVGL